MAKNRHKMQMCFIETNSYYFIDIWMDHKIAF